MSTANRAGPRLAREVWQPSGLTAPAVRRAYRDLVDKRWARASVWLLVALGAGLGILLVWGFQTGVCVDGPGPDASGCTTGPAIGVPGAVVVTVACAGVMALAVRRLVSLRAAPEPRRAG